MGAKEHAREIPSRVDGVLGHPEPRDALRVTLREDAARGAEVVRELLRRAQDAIRRAPVDARLCAALGAFGAEVLGDEDLHIKARRLLAQAHLVAGDFAAALDALDAAAKQARALGRAVEAANLDTFAITALVHLERYDEARELAQTCLDTFGRHEEVMGLLRTHVALADVEFRTDRPREALRHHACADALVPADRRDQLRAAIAANRANALDACNRFRAAQRHYEIAREIFAANGCDHTVAQVDYNAAYRDFLAGRYEAALRRYDDLEQSFARLGDERHLAHVDLDRAEVHIHLNLPDEARRLATAAERRFRALDLAKETAQAAHVLGRALELIGRRDDAKDAYHRAREGFAKLDLTEREIGCLVQCSRIEHQAGHPAEAYELMLAASTRLTSRMNALTRISVELLRADLDMEGGRLERAAARCKEVLLASRRLHAPWVRIQAWWTLARTQNLSGERDEALASLTSAIDALERYRGAVPPDEYMAAFLAARAGLYEDIIDILLERGERERAFEYAERSKARALLDLLGRSGRAPRAKTPGGARIEQLRTRLHATYQRIFQASRDAESPPVRHLRILRDRAMRLETELARQLRVRRRRTPDDIEMQSVRRPDLEGIRGDLPPGTCLLEYFVAEDWLAVFAVTADGVRVTRHRVSRQDLARRLERFHFHLSKFMRPHAPSEESVLAPTRANLLALADLLLKPLPPRARFERLVVVPHGLLHHLPFHALPWGDGWVTDRFEVVYAPSATVYGRAARRGAPVKGSPYVLGLPDEAAPQIEQEARLVAGRLAGSRLLLGAEATLASLRDGARDARILHVATHGMFRRNAPMLSAIRLADGWINLYDLYDLQVDGELVVLSTCESGTADVTGGDEILGLTRGFLHAGARALVTSQWRVHDAATAAFMDAFYSALEKGCDAAAAHRQGMAAVRAAHPHPFFWAPFFLTGRLTLGSAPPTVPAVPETPESQIAPRPHSPAARQEARS